MLIHYNKPKFVFIHTPRTGGASLEKYLIKLFDDGKNIPGQGIKRRTRHGNIDHAIEKIKSRKRDNNPDEYYKFAFVRDPWDRAVSYFHHDKQRIQRIKIGDSPELDFQRWVREELLDMDLHRYYHSKPYLHQGGTLGVDKLYRYEQYYDHVNYIVTKFGKQLSYKFPKLHTGNRPNKPYRDYYDRSTAGLIAGISQYEIQELGYEFDYHR